MRPRVVLAAALVATACTTAAEHGPAASPATPPIDAALWQRMLEAEDARVRTAEQLDVLRAALSSESDDTRAIAVRALGRTERPEFAYLIAALLNDPSEDVRAAAAHALGDVSRDTAAAIEQRALLLSVLSQPGAGGAGAAAIAESLGRLPADAAGARAVAARLAPFLTRDDDVRLGALRGLYFLARQSAGRIAVSDAAADALRTVATSSREARERGIAIGTLAGIAAADPATVRTALQDGDPQVRREAALAAGSVDDTAAVRDLLHAALRDSDPAVRYDALRTYVRRLADTRGCQPAVSAARDTSTHVALLAISLLGTACQSAANVELLDSIADTAGPHALGWHRGAQATIALALNDAGRARRHIDSLSGHASGFARAYAVGAARVVGDTALLYRFARDTSANVRTAAVTGLAATVGHEADSVYVAQLSTNESELLMAAASALEGSGHPDAPQQLLDALDRVTALHRETSRDGRVALLDRIGELGRPQLATRLEPYLNDFDERVVAKAAGIVQQWTGTRPAAETQPLPPLPLPTYTDAARLTESVFVLEMEDGGEVEVRLLPFDAPTNAARFARLARSGYFDGLTIHRVAPNFVVQGGGPGANEYSGDGPFTRDELGVPNWRGTVGLSTRGRDTGDAQFYINLIDNVRLDHEYTVFGVVTRGMAVVDRMTEGAVIRRVSEHSVR